MGKSVLTGVFLLATCAAPVLADVNNGQATEEILALERAAMDGWQHGNPDPSIAIADPGITYFHAVTDKRLDGIDSVRALFETYRGTPLFDHYEIVNPKVQVAGDAAVLTYVLVRHSGDDESRWNATQVYQRTNDGWRVIHAHWSQNKPPLRGATAD